MRYQPDRGKSFMRTMPPSLAPRLLTLIMRSEKSCRRSVSRFCSISSHLQKMPNKQPSQSRKPSSSVRKTYLLALPYIPTPNTQKTDYPHQILFFCSWLKPHRHRHLLCSLYPSPCEPARRFFVVARRRTTTGWTRSWTRDMKRMVVPTKAVMYEHTAVHDTAGDGTRSRWLVLRLEAHRYIHRHIHIHTHTHSMILSLPGLPCREVCVRAVSHVHRLPHVYLARHLRSQVRLALA